MIYKIKSLCFTIYCMNLLRENLTLKEMGADNFVWICQWQLHAEPTK